MNSELRTEADLRKACEDAIIESTREHGRASTAGEGAERAYEAMAPIFEEYYKDRH